jgi:geranylgeranyl pyrophosphate synthase
LIRLLKRADDSLRHWVHGALRHPGRNAPEELRLHLQQSGALADARGEAEKFARQARQELLCIPASAYRQTLEELTYRVTLRSC